tara:strand:+ start:1401 stop:1943 length:543 start_codon:yes stop_codon:yes gene_type:complete
MGYLDKSTKTVTAHFTKRGRELLADALSGNTTGDYIITKYALGDDEIDYSLYDESQPENLRGRVIENAPILESFVNEQEIMNSVIKRVTPPVALQSQISNIPDQIRLEGRGDIFILAPQTDNIDEIEEYEFILSHDNLVDMYDSNNPPVADFVFQVDNQGSIPGLPPTANFNYQVQGEGI